jgi:hypothetical protein
VAPVRIETGSPASCESSTGNRSVSPYLNASLRSARSASPPAAIAANTSLTNARSRGAARKLTEIACRDPPSIRKLSTNAAASSSTDTSASRNP